MRGCRGTCNSHGPGRRGLPRGPALAGFDPWHVGCTADLPWKTWCWLQSAWGSSRWPGSTSDRLIVCERPPLGTGRRPWPSTMESARWWRPCWPPTWCTPSSARKSS